ncbi:MAG TPA: glycoside hydrolase family 127 protein [Pyrinomonadaceae bacterium]|nr:glycoside hydrolase family 127 protein [Acidobacteriota bacterium]HQZ95653.1 glycoside hydrolase family 127 protein [Pyrinomonadaceae bacterium]
MNKSTFDRRKFLKVSTLAGVGLAVPLSAVGQKAGANFPKTAQPFSLVNVRLTPSPFLDAVNANLKYLIKLEPDRLLHNFRVHAGLKPKGEVYGGWERDTISGHTLGHYLTACSLMHAQTGNTEVKKRVDYIIGELAECQNQAPDGYVAGFTRKKGKDVENGRVIFDEIKAGDIRSAGFDLNGCWVPFYNWHKLFAGLFDAENYCGNKDGLKIAVRLAGFIDGVFAKLSDEQVQKMLNCEHGGLNESMAELYARTQDKRWLALAERILHNRTLGPMFAEKDELPNIHANTQIPKVIGLARLYELTNKPEYATAARFFWKNVTTNYSYVIGGNSDREYFQAPNSIATHITEQTCESCNTYNMLKLTRHLYAWNTNSSFFDYYERAHLNHIMAHQNPRTGMFAYMIPLMSGTARAFSSEFNDFWCCVGSGIESHSKHGESIYWHNDDHLIVNLFIPSTLDWAERQAKFELSTAYPLGEDVTIKFSKISKQSEFPVSLRLPYWCENPSLKVSGKAEKLVRDGGYATVKRRWKTGDTLVLTLPMKPRIEPTADDPNTIALLHGPAVLAADLGEARSKFDGVAPALVGSDLLASLRREPQFANFTTSGIGRPSEITLRPFYSQWERRTAVYFKRFSDAAWAKEQAAYAAEQARLKDLQARSVDVMHLGEMQPERDHALTSSISYPVSYRGRNGRDARTEGFFEFKAKVTDEPLTLKATYWGEERKRLFHILIDGTRIASETLGYNKPGEWIERDYPIPQELTKGRSTVTVRFEPEKGNTAGPVFGVLIFRSK